VKYPLKLVGGEWRRITWDVALDEISAKLQELRQASGPDSVYWLGSAKFTNEAAYLFRKLGAFWGTNNATTRRASATRPRSRASRTPGATAPRPTATTTSATPRR
jgi:anaerobic selenocysteine-containing dehydrogenase